MYSPDDDYYYSSRGGSHYGPSGYPGSGYYPSYPGTRSYMDYPDGDNDYYRDPHDYYHDPHDRYHDPYYSSRHRTRYAYGQGRHHYYAPKAYQVTHDGTIKTLRYGHEHFKDKLRRVCGMDPRGLRVHRH